jgi:exopolyphosphatase/guanosine-5'-triphosphate,3'-diphosphate pyrophosphatase
MPLLASIDIGSNSVRLLAAQVEDGRIVRQVLHLREVTRIAEGLKGGGRLSEAAKERTLSVLGRYSEMLRDTGVFDISAIATEGLRKASDAGEFVGRVKEKTGLVVEVISGEDEARRTLVGVRAGLAGHDYPGQKLVIDIGGGSTEFVFTPDWNHFKAVSLPLGAVSLFERFLLSDPPSRVELIDLLTHCYKVLSALDGLFKDKPALLVGTAGTVTTLAAIDLVMDKYDPARATGHRLKRATIEKLLARLTGLPKENRKLIAGLEPGREDIIISGAVLLGAIMDRSEAAEIIVCDYGLMEGNLLDYYEKRRFNP